MDGWYLLWACAFLFLYWLKIDYTCRSKNQYTWVDALNRHYDAFSKQRRKSASFFATLILPLAGFIFRVRDVFVTLFLNPTAIAIAIAIAGYAVPTELTHPISEVLWNSALPDMWIRSALILALFGRSSAFTVAIIVNQLKQKQTCFANQWRASKNSDVCWKRQKGDTWNLKIISMMLSASKPWEK